jgi:hypothetical protein
VTHLHSFIHHDDTINYCQCSLLKVKRTDAFAAARKAALVREWDENLKILNSGINRRIGGLKDMEADLEETVRLTILQHEVGATPPSLLPPPPSTR